MEQIRGFKHIKGFEDKVKLPERQTKYSSAYDFYLPEDIEITPMESIMIESGIKSYMQENEELLLSIRSKWGAKFKLILLAHKIDSDYYENKDNDGHIFISVMNLGKETFKLSKGERICQGSFYTYLLADNDNVTTERVGGIGSTNT